MPIQILKDKEYLELIETIDSKETYQSFIAQIKHDYKMKFLNESMFEAFRLLASNKLNQILNENAK